MAEPVVTPAAAPVAPVAPVTNKDVFYPPPVVAAPVVEPVVVPPVPDAAAAAAAAVIDPNKPGDKPVVTDPAKVEVKKEDLKLPEGSYLDATHVEKIASFAKEQGFSKEQAQKVLDRESELVKTEREAGVKSGMETFKAAQAEELKKVAGTWFNEAKNDKEFGGNNFSASSEKVLRATEILAGKDYPVVKQLLEATYLGNHPAFVRMMLNAHDGLGEDQIRGGKITGKTAKKTDKDVFYGNMTKQN